MKITIQMVIEDDKNLKTVKEVTCLERKELSIETLGLTLNESKLILSGIQETMTIHQAEEYTSQQRNCPSCNRPRSIKGHNPLTYRTLFGTLHFQSPRLLECTCQGQEKSTFSPLAILLSERISPEFVYLQSKWASLMSYGMTANLLEEVLPLEINPSSVINNTLKVSTRLEEDIGDEKPIFIEGCQNDWDNLSRPDRALTVGLDGGYVHGREGNNRKAGWFEVIVGKSLQEETPTKRFGYVVTYDNKPKRRLYEMLSQQGLQMNQDITFITDGGENVRELPTFISPRSEHILDWFHITMKFTVIKQMLKGVTIDPCFKVEEELESTKWHLWHGNSYKALQTLESIDLALSVFYEREKESREYKLWKAVDELYSYIEVNSNYIPNYSNRYNYGECVSSSFAESTVNELISKRMVKSQQMRWTKKGAHLLLQVRAKTLNEELKPTFEKWYPKMKQDNHNLPLAA